MKVIKFFLVCGLLALLTLSASANEHAPHLASDGKTIVLDNDFSSLALWDHVDILYTDKHVQLSDAIASSQWKKQRSIEPLKDDQAIWLKFSIDHTLPLATRFTLLIGNPSIDIINAYAVDDIQRIVHAFNVGASRSISQRPYNHRLFLMPMQLQPGQTLHMYVQIIDDGPLVFPFELWRSSQLIADEQVRLAVLGIIVGALIILFCYFMITYVLLKSPVRFWFSVSCGLFLLLFLNIHGVISQLINVSTYISETTTILTALLLFASAKVSHALLQTVPIYWRSVSYSMAAGLGITALLFDTYIQIIAGVGFAGASLLVHLLLAMAFPNQFSNIPNRVYGFGWIIITFAAVLSIGLYLAGIVTGQYADLFITFFLLTGILLIAVAIDAHEQVIAESHKQIQQNTITDLHKFYNLFTNSAEGLYTSTVDGELITANPAMCTLFGFDSEAQMLAEVKSTADFYVNESDRQSLLTVIRRDGRVLGKEIKGLRRDGSEFWFSISVQVREEAGKTFMFGSIFDITERKQSSISLEYLATHDSLTGVYNRREFERHLRSAIQHAKSANADLTLLYMDLDQFKVVNDTCGHKAGDVLIKQLSQQLNNVVKDKGMLARLGGDEFGVLLEGEQAQVSYLVATRLLNVVQEFRFIWDNRIFSLGVSIGLVSFNKKNTTAEQLLSMADAACYMAKEQGRNQIHTYSEEDEKMQRYETELKWITHINNALEQDKFVLHYQHYHPLNKVIHGHHYELLLRMQDDNGELVPPSSFLPSAERFSLSTQIDKWVIEHYFMWLGDNPEHAKKLNRCNINLSGNSLGDKEFKLFVLNLFERHGVPYHKICFEITETMAIIKLDETLEFIRTFKQAGCTFALDDFGSGFSSYSYLKNLPVDFVKIDGSFIKDLLSDPIDMAMVCSINDVAKAMKMQTVAEFVETTQLMDKLKEIGVDFAQGYAVARPTPLEEFSPYRG
ncbi:EAL domain-containing protein [Aestuariibacter sp. AA17]|uniref:EAL domain-containing protein n=1 Tax=Fluctibacter corallii TaxID=2984329 RepID=A0ABT3AC06_9ALTE|nr:EAL domain-containing protein [Aestuariibacter sp. AA17]MCV2886214.1 EAL domain-containing protein [Aestuariibacter sp. AA17]